MTPRGLLELAKRLAQEPDEASQRAAVSRAYYAAFLHVRQRLEDEGLYRRERRAVDHQRVEAALLRLSEPGHLLLGILRNRRNEADYDIEEEFPTPVVDFSLQCAERLLDI